MMPSLTFGIMFGNAIRSSTYWFILMPILYFILLGPTDLVCNNVSNLTAWILPGRYIDIIFYTFFVYAFLLAVIP